MTFQLAACAEMLQPRCSIHRRAVRLNELGYNGPVGMEAFACTKNKTRLKRFVLHSRYKTDLNHTIRTCSFLVCDPLYRVGLSLTLSIGTAP